MISLSVKGILFDFGGTLDAAGVPWKERFRRLFSEFGVTVGPERFDHAFYDADDALVGRLSADANLTETVHRLAAGVARNLGVPGDRIGREVAENFLRESFHFFRRNRPVLERLSKRFRLGIVSNFYGNLQAVCAEAEIEEFFDPLIDSTVVGVSKPDPKIFRAGFEPWRLPPERVLFVGDSPNRDMAGAKALGMPHIRLLPPERLKQATLCCPGDRAITSLKELWGGG